MQKASVRKLGGAYLPIVLVLLLFGCSKNFPGKGKYEVRVSSKSMPILTVLITTTDKKFDQHVYTEEPRNNLFSKKDIPVDKAIKVQVISGSNDLAKQQLRDLVRKYFGRQVAGQSATGDASSQGDGSQDDDSGGDSGQELLTIGILRNGKLVRKISVRGKQGQPFVVGELQVPTLIPFKN